MQHSGHAELTPEPRTFSSLLPSSPLSFSSVRSVAMSPKQLNLKKPENRTRCLVTFSKRKSSLIKKARNLSVSCGIDIALVAFSPAARPNMFCSQDRFLETVSFFSSTDYLYLYLLVHATMKMMTLKCTTDGDLNHCNCKVDDISLKLNLRLSQCTGDAYIS